MFMPRPLATLDRRLPLDTGTGSLLARLHALVRRPSRQQFNSRRYRYLAVLESRGANDRAINRLLKSPILKAYGPDRGLEAATAKSRLEPCHCEATIMASVRLSATPPMKLWFRIRHQAF